MPLPGKSGQTMREVAQQLIYETYSVPSNKTTPFILL
jgi:hypothetical protein